MPRHGIPENKPIRVEYSSKEVKLPAGFLPPVPTASDAQPITMTPVDWKTTALPENDGRYAVVLDHVLSRSECAELLRLAEASVASVRIGPRDGGHKEEKKKKKKREEEEEAQSGQPWQPAMVNVGGGYEVLDTTYRHSDRIIWDSQEVVDRLWARCMQATSTMTSADGANNHVHDVGAALRARLAVLAGNEGQRVVGGGGYSYQGRKKRKGEEEEEEAWTQRWEMRGLNRRMRFLRYGPGQFFKPHCDSYYAEEVDGRPLRTMFTVHLYLNDSVQAEEGGGAEGTLVDGGATSFLSSHGGGGGDNERRVDVHPQAGRVLLFQHLGLCHAGAEVMRGIKYTMRTEVMYERVDHQG